MPPPALLATRPDRALFHLKSPLTQPPSKRRIGGRRPDRKDTFRPQGHMGHANPRVAIEPIIAAPSEPIRAIIHVKNDAIIGTGIPLKEQGDIHGLHDKPRVLQGISSKGGQGTLVPENYRRDQFGHHYPGLVPQS